MTMTLLILCRRRKSDVVFDTNELLFGPEEERLKEVDFVAGDSHLPP